MSNGPNPAGRTRQFEILENLKRQQQELTTPRRAGLESFFPEDYASNIAAIDVTERAFGVDQPITEGLGSFTQFEGKGMTPSEELSTIGRDNIGSFSTFREMVNQGLISADPKSGEVFTPNSIEELSSLFQSGDFSPSVLYDKSLGERVAEFRNFERARQSVEEDLAGSGGFLSGFLGGDPNLTPQYVGAELSGQNVSLDYINEKFSKAVPVDQDPTENEEFMALLKEYDPVRYKRIMQLKRNIDTIKDPNFDPALAQKTIQDLIGTTTDLGDGRKLVAINLDPADPEDFNTYSDIAAPGSPGYVGGQFAQLGIEFVPFVGMFDNVARSAVRLGGAGAAKIFGKDLDKIKVVCSSPCRLDAEGKKILQRAEKDGKIKEGMADALEARLKLKAESREQTGNVGKTGLPKNIKSGDTYTGKKGDKRVFIKKDEKSGNVLSLDKDTYDSLIELKRENPSLSNVAISEQTGIALTKVSSALKGAKLGEAETLANLIKVGELKSGASIRVSQEQYDNIVKLKQNNPKITQAEIQQKLNLNDQQVFYTLKHSKLSSGVTQSEKNLKLQEIANYLSETVLPTKQIKINSKFMKEMSNKFNLKPATLMGYLHSLKLEAKGKTSRKLLLSDDLMDKLNRLPSMNFVADDLRLLGYSEQTIKKLNDVNKAVRSIANSRTEFEHALPRSVINQFGLGKQFNLMGERTSAFLNQFKKSFDGQLLNLATDFVDGNITLSQYNKAVREIRNQVKLATGGKMKKGRVVGGYEMGYLKFNKDGTFKAVTPHVSFLKGKGELGAKTTGLINFFKNVKYHNALYEAYKKNPNNPAFTKEFKSFVNKKSKDKFLPEKALAKVYDDIKNFTTVEQFLKYYKKNYSNPFFQALSNGIAKVGTTSKKDALITGVATTPFLTSTLKAEEHEGDFFEEDDFFEEREKFQTPGLGGQSQEERFLASQLAAGVPVPGSIEFSVDQATKNVQRDIQDMYAMNLRESTDRAIETIQLRREDIQATLADKLNPPRPVKFKFSELPRLVTQSPLLQAATTDPRVAGLETIEFIYNSLRRGVENDIEMEEKFPKIYKLNELTKVKGPGPTPDEQDYISAIDEFNRAADTGLTNFAYNVLDFAFSIPDAVLPTEFTEELKRRYEESDMSKPETFVGQIASVALEFGIPGGIVFKLINRFRKAVLARTQGEVNLFAQKTYALEGLPKLGVQISNVAKRVGTGMVSFGAADFIAGGPYNTLTEMFDDPLLSSKLVGEYQDTSELSGKERVAANFKNRLRFGAEGAMIGGLFPLVGPALGAIGKNVLLKPTLFVGGGLLKTANVLAIKPATYLASKDPIVLPGLARGVGVFGEFLGKDVLARLAATAATGGRALIPSLKKGNMGQLPDFDKWRMFDVTSNDPLEAGLKRVDNFLKWFREAGNQTLYAFNLSGGAERFIKSKAREIEKYIDGIERKAYDLANGFLGRYNKGFTSPAGERHMLEQVYEYLRGNLKLTKIEPELRELAKALKDEFDQIRSAYFKELPEGSGMRAALESNLDKYMRMSFATFTNPNYIPNQAVIDDAVTFMTEIITKNEDFLEAAVKGVPITEQAAAIREFARANVDNIIAIGKREGVDPLNALNQINREILRGDDVLLQTGEELPKVIRNLLGQEKNLRASVMSTTGSLVSQTANIKAFKEFARHGLENGYLFTSRAEALAAGVTDPGQIRNLPGLGQMQDLATVDKDGPIGLFASNEIKRTVENTGGMLDSLLQNSFYQSLIAYKAAVQTGKTVFSPATQTRNFGSAGFFPMHVGHIGGGASVTDAFKIVMDDIFGAGRTVNEVDLIKRIQRKVELGVLDENIVASELGAILKDIKAGKLQSIGKLAERAENTKFYKTATRVYAGGDNVWKWYGHEYYMSQLKGAFKNINEVKRFFEDIHGIEYNVNNIMTGARKTLDEGIEEAAAFLLRETYPTYSKVPEFIKAIRKLPIGNFVSFTSEILRTGFSTSAVAMKHIASDNQVLREMGYRMLTGQAITLGGMTAGVTALGHALTNVTPTQVDVYKEFFAPEYMKYSTLIPVSNVENGTFKVFDFSRYNPYDIIVASSKQLLKVADRKNYSKELAQLKEQHAQLDPDSEEARELRRRMKEIKIRLSFGQTLDPEKIQTDTLRQYLSYVGPLYDSVTGTFFGIPIGAEAFLEAASGRTRQGSPIWSKGMADTEIFDRSMAHFFKTIEPGIISSGRKLFYSLRGDVSGVGQPLEVDTEIFKLMGGSNVTVDIMGSLDFKISAFQQSFREARVAKDFFSTENFQSRGPEQLVREYNEQNEQAFRAQYEFYKAAMAAIDSGLLTRTEILKALGKRLAPGSDSIPTKAIMLMNGFYTPLSYGPEGLKSRREKILRNNPDLDQRIYNYQYFFPLGMLEAEKRRWKGIRFQDMERELEQPDKQSAAPVETPQVAPVEEPQVAELPTTPAPVVQAQVPDVNPQTGLTTTETALLSPGEQAIRQRQKGVA